MIDRFLLAVVAVTMAALGSVPTRVHARNQEHGVTPAEIERGGQVFLSSCAACHGPGGDTLPGANLATGTFRRATTDQELVNIIRSGIPGTAMPPSSLLAADAALVVAYLRSLPARLTAPAASGLGGSASNGQAIFSGKGACTSCHLVGGVGGFLGPDLSSVGLTRSAAELERALTNPSADIRTGNRSVKVVKKDGTTIVGRLLNHDTYSLQMIDAAGHLLSLQKDALRQWEIPETSAMPGTTGTLSAQEVADVVSYLQTMTAPVPGGAGGRGAGGAGGRGGPGAPGAPGGGRGGAQ